MKKLFVALVTVLTLISSSNSLGRGGGGFSSSSRSSSFSSSSSSRGSSYSSSSRGSSYGNSSSSSRSSGYGNSSSSSRGASYGNSSSSASVPYTRSGRGYFGGVSSNSGAYGNGNIGTAEKPRYSARSILEDSPATMRVGYGYEMSVYHYYYPGYFYGSGYNWYRYYFWMHIMGNHDQCYHNGGGKAAIRTCKLDADCTKAESCNLKTNSCQIRAGTW